MLGGEAGACDEPVRSIVLGMWDDGFFTQRMVTFFFSALVTVASADKFQLCGLASMDFRATATIWPTFAFDGEQVVTAESAS